MAKPKASSTHPVPSEIDLSVDAALDKQAADVMVLDLRGLSDVTDFFVICHGSSDRQTGAIADEIERRLRELAGRKPTHVEGRRRGEWILMDYVDVVIHVFLESKREFYRLERLWGDAPRLDAGSRDLPRREDSRGTGSA